MFHFHGEIVHDVTHNLIIAIGYLSDQQAFLSMFINSCKFMVKKVFDLK